MEKNNLEKIFYSQLISFSYSLDKMIEKGVIKINFTLLKDKEKEFEELKKFVNEKIKNKKIVNIFNQIKVPINKTVKIKYYLYILLQITMIIIFPALVFFGILYFLKSKNNKIIINHLNNLNNAAKETISIYNNLGLFEK